MPGDGLDYARISPTMPVGRAGRRPMPAGRLAGWQTGARTGWPESGRADGVAAAKRGLRGSPLAGDGTTMGTTLHT